MKVWIRSDKKHAFKQVDESQLIDHVHSPKGMKRWISRKETEKSKEVWEYVCWGTTQQECYDNATEWLNRRITKLEKEIESERQRMIQTYGPRPEGNSK